MSERELILAIIEQAVLDAETDVTKFKGKEKREEAIRAKEDAESWLNSNSNKYKSFNWYCNLLDMSPSWVRRKIKERKFPMGALNV